MFFQDCKTVNQIKAEYRRLCFIHHPDMGGDTATMQELNREYHEALSRADGETNIGTDGKPHTYYYNEAAEQAVMDKINELLNLRLPNIDILLVGTWVWVTGDTKPVKEQLKSLKMRWHSKRQKWYWHTKSYRRRYNSKASFNDLCDTYGVKSYSQPQDERAGLSA